MYVMRFRCTHSLQTSSSTLDTNWEFLQNMKPLDPSNVRCLIYNLIPPVSLSGLHDPKKLSKICQDFVKEVLLCPRCKLPEIALCIEHDGKSEKVKGKCRSCGFQGWMFEHNPKFANFVIKNPPAAVTDFGNQMDNDFLSKFSNMNITEGAFFSSNNSASSEEEDQPSFEEDVKKALEANQPSSKMKLLEQAVKGHAKSSMETSQIVFDTIFGAEHKDQEFLSNLKAHQQLLQLFLHSDPQRLNSFLEALMQRLESLSPTQQKIILKMFYDEEIVEEDELIGWFDSCQKNLQDKFPAVVESLTSFVEWLKQPSDESDEE